MSGRDVAVLVSVALAAWSMACVTSAGAEAATLSGGEGEPVHPVMDRPLASGLPDDVESPSSRGEWLRALGVGGFVRADYYSASKRLDDIHSLPGLAVQPKALPKFGSWGDGKLEARLTDQDLRRSGGIQARLLEAYVNLYGPSLDLRIGKQLVTWGRADALNPTDNLTPKDFTLLSAKDEEERRIGSYAVRANFYRGTYTVSAIWIPLFNPSTIPLTPPPGLTLTEDKRDSGALTFQGLALKVDQTGGVVDWSVSYYTGLDVNPIGVPLSPTHVELRHTRLHVVGADFARTLGRYGIRGEVAYTHTQNPKGDDPFIKRPFVFAVVGVDRDIVEDLNINLQVYQRTIVNYRDPFAIEDAIVRSASVLNATFNQQLDQYQYGLTGRIKASWWNQTLEGELLSVWNINRGDVFVRPSLAYAFTDVWKGFVGWDLFTGQRNSFFGRLQPTSAFFAELRATF